MRRVFISYASHDASMAQKVCSALEGAGFPCWMAPRDVVPGMLYADGIVRAMNESTILVLILSKSAVASAHVGKELSGPPLSAIRLLHFGPMTDRSPAFEYFLSESQWIDVETGGTDAAIASLVGAVQQHLLRGSATTHPPSRADDGWFRDNGPTFVLDRRDAVLGVDWGFNGWGGRSPYAKDRLAASVVLDQEQIERVAALFVLEASRSTSTAKAR